MALSALVLNCTLKPGPEPSNTGALAQVLVDSFTEQGVGTEVLRLVDHDIHPGVVSEAVSEGDAWPAVHDKIVAADILVVATPTWLGMASSVCQRALERMDALLSETDDQGRPVAYDKVAGVVVTGNEDGAHHIIGTTAQALIEIGFTVPGQAWTYWHPGPGPGPNYLDTDEGHEWSDSTGRSAASNLVAVARALQATPIPAP